jgi:hypothetical protein
MESNLEGTLGGPWQELWRPQAPAESPKSPLKVPFRHPAVTSAWVPKSNLNHPKQPEVPEGVHKVTFRYRAWVPTGYPQVPLWYPRSLKRSPCCTQKGTQGRDADICSRGYVSPQSIGLFYMAQYLVSDGCLCSLPHLMALQQPLSSTVFLLLAVQGLHH